MAQLPAICESCGRAFPSGFGGSNAQGFTSLGNMQQCPYCGGIGRVPDGVYDLHPDIAILMFGPKASHDALRRAYEQLSEAVATQSRDGAIEALEKISPEVAQRAMSLTEQRLWNALQVLVQVLSFLLRSS